MGNYVTYTELEQRVTLTVLQKLTKYTSGTSPTLETYCNSDIIPRAEGRIDAYANVRYSTPLPPNDMCQEWALTIAEYELYRRTVGGTVPDKIRQAYEDCLKELQRLADGKLSISGTTAPEAETSTLASVQVASNDPLFSADNFVGF
jgi:phage gp36-like protein